MLLPFTIALRGFLIGCRRRPPRRPRRCSYQLFRGVFANDKNCSRFVRTTRSERLRLLSRNIDDGGTGSVALLVARAFAPLRCLPCLCQTRKLERSSRPNPKRYNTAAAKRRIGFPEFEARRAEKREKSGRKTDQRTVAARHAY